MKNNTSILVADISETYARFASFSRPSEKLTDIQTYVCSEYERPEYAINDYLIKQDIERLEGICIAAAGPVIENSINVTNNNWKISASKLKNIYKTKNIKLLNDFEAIAYSFPHLAKRQYKPVCNIIHLPQKEHFTYGLLGPGSGLGVAGLCCREGQQFAIVTEGGHISFAPVTNLQLEILSILKNKYDRVIDEHLISGPGLVNLYDALCEIDSIQSKPHSPATIFAAACEPSDPVAAKSVGIFFEILGQVAGDLVLSLGAYDGIFISGGIVQRYSELLIKSSFHNHFINKGCHQHLLEKTPVWLITDKYPGLLGTRIYIKNYITKS